MAGIEGDRALLGGIAEAIRSPAFPLYLGRRSCPPSHPLVHELTDAGLSEALGAGTGWVASRWHRRNVRSEWVSLGVFRDAESPIEVGDRVRDVPVSFDETRREYGWRTVVHEQVDVRNPDFDRVGGGSPSGSGDLDHDYLAPLGG